MTATIDAPMPNNVVLLGIIPRPRPEPFRPRLATDVDHDACADTYSLANCIKMLQQIMERIQREQPMYLDIAINEARSRIK